MASILTAGHSQTNPAEAVQLNNLGLAEEFQPDLYALILNRGVSEWHRVRRGRRPQRPQRSETNEQPRRRWVGIPQIVALRAASPCVR